MSDRTNEKVQVKPCPFCGSRAEVTKCQFGEWLVQCSGYLDVPKNGIIETDGQRCGEHMEVHTELCEDEQTAINIWNKRIKPDNVEGK